jgi:hypothetical protein
LKEVNVLVDKGSVNVSEVVRRKNKKIENKKISFDHWLLMKLRSKVF